MRTSVSMLLVAAIAGLAGCKREVPAVPVVLPAGTAVIASVVSGVEVPVGAAAWKKPAHIVLALDSAPLQHPNGQCQVQGIAAGDMASARVAVKAHTLRCVLRNGKTMTKTIQALAAEDGTVGIRGVLSHPAEQVLSVNAGRKVTLVLTNMVDFSDFTE